MPLLSVRDLRTYYYGRAGTVPAVDGVSFDLEEDSALGIVGESGCGKSTVAFSIFRLIDEQAGRIVSGEILFEGADLLKKSQAEMTAVRGDRMGMIFQNPLTSLNPVFRIGDQIAETILLHRGDGPIEAERRALELLKQVGIPSPERRLEEYPHQLSGGMQQRVMIAIALACEPKLLVADEPTTALDVTIQAQILDLIRELRQRLRMAVILITHNLGLVAELCDQVLIMYAGKVVERCSIATVFDRPVHPYTEGLIASIPDIDHDVEELRTIPGVVPHIVLPVTGCRFANRCAVARDICRTEEPPLVEVASRHDVACWVRAGDGGVHAG
jgi:peptide/nickel transport system ATP-binding protein/oligopeptide transport system ATP-binding protein